jgi:hypothetical protein
MFAAVPGDFQDGKWQARLAYFQSRVESEGLGAAEGLGEGLFWPCLPEMVGLVSWFWLLLLLEEEAEEVSEPGVGRTCSGVAGEWRRVHSK